jgi:hypothetical protein
MSNLKWPIGATHRNPGTNCFYKLVRDIWYQVFSDGSTYISSSLYNGKVKAYDLIARHDDKPWSGPEDGLPPVGTKCRVVKVDGIDAPLDAECKIVAHEMNGENMVAVYMHGKPYEMYAGIGLSHCFSLIKELDARETAIREIMDAAGIDCRVTAARLVDAGFKRESV